MFCLKNSILSLNNMNYRKRKQLLSVEHCAGSGRYIIIIIKTIEILNTAFLPSYPIGFWEV